MSGQAQVQKKYDTLYDDVKVFFSENTSGKLSGASVTTLVRYCMELVQTSKQWKNLKGSEKKDLVLGVITEVVTDLMNDPEIIGEDFDEGKKDAILTALAMAPMIIDAAVDFAKVYTENPGNGGSGGNGGGRRFCCF